MNAWIVSTFLAILNNGAQNVGGWMFLQDPTCSVGGGAFLEMNLQEHVVILLLFLRKCCIFYLLVVVLFALTKKTSDHAHPRCYSSSKSLTLAMHPRSAVLVFNLILLPNFEAGIILRETYCRYSIPQYL